MHGQQACLLKYITNAAFHIYAECGEDAAKIGGHALNNHGNYIVDHGKSWKNTGLGTRPWTNRFTSTSTTIVKGSSKSHMVDADWSDIFPSPN